MTLAVVAAAEDKTDACQLRAMAIDSSEHLIDVPVSRMWATLASPARPTSLRQFFFSIALVTLIPMSTSGTGAVAGLIARLAAVLPRGVFGWAISRSEPAGAAVAVAAPWATPASRRLRR